MRNVLMVNYAEGERLVAELGDNNPKYINCIVNELDAAIDALSGVPGAESIISGLNKICDTCAAESKRYEEMAGVIDAFYKEVQAMDIALKESVSQSFQDELENRDYQFQLNMIKNRTNIRAAKDKIEQ